MKGEFYKMDFRAWNVGTVDLTLEQEAAYLRLCHAIYDARGPIPNSIRLLMGIFRCGNVKARALVAHLVSTGKIEETEDGLLTNRRVSAELLGRDSLSSERSVAGKRGGTASGVARAKSLKNKEDGEATASSKRTIEEERREEESREEEKKAASQQPVQQGEEQPLPWEVEGAVDNVVQLDRRGQAYAFEAGIIRLNQRDYDRFKGVYKLLNLDAELMSMARWVEQEAGRKGGDWYNPMVGALGKKQREAEKSARENKARIEADARLAAGRSIPRPAI